jgi:hypothetical protein
MKSLWSIPEDHAFRELYPEAYPLWLIKKELKNREEKGHFEGVNLMVWTFLRLGQTYKVCLGIPEASLSESLEILVGPAPIKSKLSKLKKAEQLGGEKKYIQLFKRYKSVFHFIAALAVCKKENPEWDRNWSCVYPPHEPIERFLKVAHWFRKNLLLLERRNVKDRVFLKQEDLYPLPDWVQSEDINISIEPYKERVKAIRATAKLIDPATKLVIKEGPEVFS